MLGYACCGNDDEMDDDEVEERAIAPVLGLSPFSAPYKGNKTQHDDFARDVWMQMCSLDGLNTSRHLV
jgi:hypothetical protein